MSDYISRDAAKQILSVLLVKDAAECACNLIDSVFPADVEPVRRWIPCSERLPEMFKSRLGIEYSETVFALTTGRKIMAAYLRRVPGDKAIWIAPFDFWEAYDEEITHWVEFPPLPELPDKGGNGNG